LSKDYEKDCVRAGQIGGLEPFKGRDKTSGSDEEFELKQAIRDLFAELARVNNGTVVRLEFKRGLPCLLETT